MLNALWSLKGLAALTFSLVLLSWVGCFFGNYLEGRTLSLFFVIFPTLLLAWGSFALFSVILGLLTLINFRNRFLWGCLIFTAGLWASFNIFETPGYEDGMASRLREVTNEQELLDFAKAVRQSNADTDTSRLSRKLKRPKGFDVLTEIFAPFALGISEGSVYLECGSALVGHWGLIIFDQSQAIEPMKGPYSRNPGLFVFERVWVYRGM